MPAHFLNRARLVCLLCSSALTSPCWAEAPISPEQRAEWASQLQEAEALRLQAKAAEQKAADVYASELVTCRTAFQENACIKDAARRRNQALRDARQIDLKGLEQERAVQKAERDARQRHAAEVLQARQPGIKATPAPLGE